MYYPYKLTFCACRHHSDKTASTLLERRLLAAILLNDDVTLTRCVRYDVQLAHTSVNLGLRFCPQFICAFMASLLLAALVD